MSTFKRITVFLFAAILLVGGCICLRYQHTSAKRLENRYDELIEPICSTSDADHDGIDDQTDILNGSIEYISTKPKYKSKYYNTGYPNDEYGVCTDVVANALLGAGYDLKKLVQEDIAANPSDYEIDEPDENIDFRRVRNLYVYFSHTARSLTTDVIDIKEWQGGDIVIFKKHIGIVSDRRNAHGVPYVIHHNGPFQRAYEQDVLEKRKDIVGHFRLKD